MSQHLPQDPSDSTSPSEKSLWSSLNKWFKKHFEIQITRGPFTVKTKTLTGAIVLLVATSVLAIAPYLAYHQPAASALFQQPSVQVFFPDPTRPSESAFYQDGKAQREGFERARRELDDELPNHLPTEFQPMLEDENPEDVLRKLQNLYEQKEATYFVMTMSGKIARLRNYFKQWHDQCVHDGKREPILITTVASAPGLADAKSGILRWYVRSEEESALVAEYMRWKIGAAGAIVFYVTCRSGQADDSYGKRGMEVFRDRFSALGGRPPETVSVTAKAAKNEVKKFLAKKPCADVCAYVIGYGDMLKETVTELVTQGFLGSIACTSTLTNPEWQPEEETADKRICTLVPRLRNSQERLEGEDRNIVFYFARNTLARVLRLTAKASNPSRFTLARILRFTTKEPNHNPFIEQWLAGEKGPPLDQSYLANGDAIVELEIVGADVWRWKRRS